MKGIQLLARWLVAAVALVLSATFPVVFASTATLNAASSGASLNQNVDVFIDQSGKMDLREVMAQAVFTPTNGVAGLGLVPHPVWLRFSLQRAADAPRRWWLEILPFSVAEISLYRPDEAGRYSVLTAGEMYPFLQRGFSYRQYLYPLDLPSGQAVTLYFRVVNDNANVLPLHIWQLEHWAQRATLEYLVLGCCIGVMLGLAFYNLLLFARLRDRLFLLYFLLMCSYVLFIGDLHGLASQLLWPDNGLHIRGMDQAIISLYAALGSLFALWLLQGGGLSDWFGRLMYPLVALYVVNVGAALAGYSGFAGAVIHYVPYFLFTLILAAAIYRSIQGFRPALYYLIGYGPVLYTLTLLLLMGQGKVAANGLNQVLYVIAGAWEAILFSQALAARVSLLLQEKEHAQQLAIDEKAGRLDDAERHREELEDKVARRTMDLANEISSHKETLDMLRASQGQLTNLAYHDGLTELPNRRMLLDRFDYMAGLARRQHSEFAVALIDIDRFKNINDTRGHDVGDQLLVKVAQKLRAAVRETDIVGRLGGDEFMLILSMPLDDTALLHLLERLHEAFGEPMRCGGMDADGSISLGVAWYGRHGTSFQDLHKRADLAMYDVKNAGGNAYRIYAD